MDATLQLKAMNDALELVHQAIQPRNLTQRCFLCMNAQPASQGAYRDGAWVCGGCLLKAEAHAAD